MIRFDRDTSVSDLGEGRFAARIDPAWGIVRGPNGGYLAAILLRAMSAAVDDAKRSPRSFTVHYTAPPQPGPVGIQVVVERRGRSLSTLSARMEQQGKLVALALAAFSLPREAVGFQHRRAPGVPPPEGVPPLPDQEEHPIPFRRLFDTRWCIGEKPWTGSAEALAGGWLRLAEPRGLDPVLLALYADSWPPAVFSWAKEGSIRAGAPTVDLTLHFRTPIPPAETSGDGFALAVFRTRTVNDGFFEEDGEIWSRDGSLLVQSRQLALLL